MLLLWLQGVVARRPVRLLGVAGGIALTVGLLGALGVFIAASSASMTKRALADVPVDWQVQLAPGVDPAAASTTLTGAVPTSAVDQVGYADSVSFSATTGGTVQTTGAGKVLGLGASYSQHFPAELRPLVGATSGVLVAQQTAANLHVAPGDTVTVQRPGLPPVQLRVDGVVDLPNADSLFQVVGAQPGTAPQAPPDNVLVLPLAQWHQLFDPQAAAQPASVHLQLHVRLIHALPADPAAAYTTVQALAHNVEARLVGGGGVGNNLAVRLGSVRSDARYAQLLFLFLGLPGAILGGLLTLAVASAGADRRRREQALLRTRGASTALLLRLATGEAVLTGLVGAASGLLLAWGAGRIVTAAGTTTATTLVWWGAAAVGGLALGLLAVLVPAWRQTRQPQWQAGRTVVGRPRAPLWQRLYLDIGLLALAGVAFWQAASTGYQVVLAPEGVPQTSVAYQAFIAPVCLWVGAALLALRLVRGSLTVGRPLLTGLLRPLLGGLAGPVAATLARQRVLISRASVLIALAFSFAIATAVFNTTYNGQAGVDAALTNGADVTVTGSTAAPAGDKLSALAALPGVVAAQPLQHRFAYVGTDLQDLYGIDSAHIGTATHLADAFFTTGNARQTMRALAARPDGILVAAETAKDFQLQPGDLLQLRLQSAQDQQYHLVPFHFVGIVREFPTAPKDSFLVANAAYVAQQTSRPAAEVVLLRTSGSPAAVAAQARPLAAGIGATVTELGSVRRTIGSSLTAVDLRGLTRLELSFAVVAVAAATGLVLALGLAERRRMFAILSALGARHGQLGAFIWSEGGLLLLSGALVGSVIGVLVAQVLVKLLTGVFDPPPAALSVPWLYLMVLGGAAVVSTAAAMLGAWLLAQRAALAELQTL